DRASYCQHSFPTRRSSDLVAIGVRAEGEHVYLSIEDNGRGLQKVREARQPGFGMIGMRARARNAGGELFLRSSEAGGLLIEVRRSEEHTSELQSRFDLVCR